MWWGVEHEAAQCIILYNHGNIFVLISLIEMSEYGYCMSGPFDVRLRLGNNSCCISYFLETLNSKSLVHI